MTGNGIVFRTLERLELLFKKSPRIPLSCLRSWMFFVEIQTRCAVCYFVVWLIAPFLKAIALLVREWEVKDEHDGSVL